MYLLLSIIYLSLSSCHSKAYPTRAEDPGRPSVQLPNGVVLGKTVQVLFGDSKINVNQYLGIPFAQSPPARFALPEDPLVWDSPWDASYFRNSCIQTFPSAEIKAISNNPPPPESEDCLYLNIFAPPTHSGAAPLPVLFWIHGGSFSLGSARMPDFDGTSIAANQGVIVVTTNYRLNVFGFPGSPAIPLEQRNLGFFDQRKALEWVNKHIGAFGGNASQVTIMGESAGGWSVKELIINPPSPPQFRAAILQSQAFGPRQDSELAWDALVVELGCNSSDTAVSQLQCVSQAPAESIRRAIETQNLAFTPIIDNVTNGPSLEESIRQGRAADVPVLIGTNADEGTMLAQFMPPPDQFLDQIFGSDERAKRATRSAYPANATAMELKSLITTDYLYTCSTSAIARAMVRSGQKVWRYYFNASFPNNQPFTGAGAWHTSEIGLVIGTYPRNNLTTADQVRLSRTMQQAWGDFAKAPERGPGWAAMGSPSAGVRLFDAGDAVSGQSIDETVVDDICVYYEAALRGVDY